MTEDQKEAELLLDSLYSKGVISFEEYELLIQFIYVHKE